MSLHPVFGDADILVKTKVKQELVASNTLNDRKYIILYFSAHWCPPCKAFTPVLASWYAKHANQTEIVFISLDHGENDYKSYYSEMPWAALPYVNRALIETLTADYNISSLPTLIVIDNKTGKMVSKNARTHVQTQPENFPWI